MLYFIPTPIGNRGDMTLRAIEVLQEVDFIACEDTRHSLPLLKHFEIRKELIALHDHNEGTKAAELIALLKSGKKIAIISDAGMPCISDPGYRLMQAVIAADIPYSVLPGPSAVLTALVGSGFPVHKRLQMLTSATEGEHTSIFFESPHRITSTLELMAKEYPEHPVCVARELTKKFETYHKGSAAELYTYFSERKAKGEIVFLVAPANYSSPEPC